MEIECNGCGEVFTAGRSDARYCSSRCRVASHRKRTAPPTPLHRRPPAVLLNRISRMHRDVTKLEELVGGEGLGENVAVDLGMLELLGGRLAGVIEALRPNRTVTDASERAGATDWSRQVQRVSADIPMEDLTHDEVEELLGAAEYLRHYAKGELVTRRVTGKRLGR